MTDSTTVEQLRNPLPVGGVRLVVVDGADRGAAIEVEREVLVGTSEACDLRLRDPAASRRHFIARPTVFGLELIDQDSRNGTWLGDQRLFHAQLVPGAEVKVASITLRVEALAAKPEPTPRAASVQVGIGRFVGAAPSLDELYRRVERVVPTDATVLIEGESGTGKELLAEAIHEAGPRSGAAFVILDCGAVPASLIEDRLFGHEKGAFTGADRARPGVFEEAGGGTLFLDEIGELPVELQTRLLRVLDRGQVTRIGATRHVDVDVRVLAATHRNLERDVEDGRFRLDLFHRLAVVLLRVPPLRDRPEDVERLARQFLRAYGAEEGLLTDEVLARFARYRWPGNVRELRNHVERLVVLGETDTPDTSEAPGEDPARSGLPFRRARDIALSRFTRTYVADMLARHDGNVSAAARTAGLTRRYFQQLKQDRG